MKREPLVVVAAVPGDEELHRVGVADDHARGEHDLAHVLDVAEGDDVLEAEELAGGDRQVQHHREAAEDGARDEVGREDRRVPAGHLRGGEVERHDRVHRQHQRRREAGEEQIRPLVAVPVPARAGPAERRRCRRRSA